jgi:hypothetical protein
MTLNKMKYLLLVFLIVTIPFMALKRYQPKGEVIVKDDTYYHILATEIDNHYSKMGRNTSAKVIYTVITESTNELKERFPRGEFTIEDILAIVSMESGFNEKSIGPHGEKGLFQILDSASALAAIGCIGKNPHDPKINTKMGLFVLSTKYCRYQDKKKAIISYNGVVVTATGWSEEYWCKFLKARGVISELVRKADSVRTLKVT